jgi:hypothetical protein
LISISFPPLRDNKTAIWRPTLGQRADGGSGLRTWIELFHPLAALPIESFADLPRARLGNHSSVDLRSN